MRLATKRITSLTCAAALMISLAACSSTTASSSESTAEGTSMSAPGEGTPPDKPDGEGGGPGGQGGPGGGFGGSGTVTQGTSANTIDTDTTVYSESYESTGDDENALRVDGATVTLSGVTVSKSAGKSSNTEDGDFYGQNAALLATNGATVTIENSTITSSAQNGNGVFSYGEGTTVNISDSAITLSGVTLSNEDTSANLMTIAGNSASHGWGTAGSNGAQVELTADAQTLSGAITVDSISTLDFTLKNGSSFTGTINIVDNADGGTAVDDNAVVTIEEGSTWTLTGNCTLTSLTNNGTISFNGYTITLADGTVLK